MAILVRSRIDMPFFSQRRKLIHPFSLIHGRLFCIALISLWLSVSNGNGQTIRYTTEKFDPNSIAEVVAPPDAVDLVVVSGGPTGKIWFRQGNEGILIFGKLNEKRPQGPSIPLEIKTHSHIDLWISGIESVSMPEIGWGNQFGYTDCRDCLADPASCDKQIAEQCRKWNARQETYRNLLRRLFVRRWHLAPKVSKEDFATPAYADILDYAADSQRPAFKKLEPGSNPQYKDAGFTGNWGFEILVRWSDLPPVRELNLSNLFIVVEGFNSDGTYSSTAPNRKGGDPSTFNKLQLERPVPFVIGPCKYSLTGSDQYGETLPAWYRPSDDGTVSDIFILRNDAAGYRYEPEGLSPIPAWTHFFKIDLEDGRRICGPLLRCLKDDKVFESNDEIDQDRFFYKKLPDGSYLLQSGPVMGTLTRFGTGAGGATPTIQIKMFHLGIKGAIKNILDLKLSLDFIDLTDMDIQFSSDWKSITVYRQKNEDWSSTRYCLKDDRYEECGSGHEGPPEPRQVDLE
jgi:hypothetical protein